MNLRKIFFINFPVVHIPERNVSPKKPWKANMISNIETTKNKKNANNITKYIVTLLKPPVNIYRTTTKTVL